MKPLERSPIVFPGQYQSVGGILSSVIGDLSHDYLEEFLRQCPDDASGYALLRTGSDHWAELHAIPKHFLAHCGAGCKGLVSLHFGRKMESHDAVFILINDILKLVQGARYFEQHLVVLKFRFPPTGLPSRCNRGGRSLQRNRVAILQARLDDGDVKIISFLRGGAHLPATTSPQIRAGADQTGCYDD